MKLNLHKIKFSHVKYMILVNFTELVQSSPQSNFGTFPLPQKDSSHTPAVTTPVPTSRPKQALTYFPITLPFLDILYKLIQYMVFCVFLPNSIQFFRFIHVLRMSQCFFLCITEQQYFIEGNRNVLLMDLGCFYFLAITNTTEHSHTSLCIDKFSFVLGIHIGMELLGHIINFYLSLKKNCHRFPQWLHHSNA